MKSIVIKYGTIYAVIVLISSILYLFGYAGMAITTGINLVCLFVGFWFAGQDYKKGNDGYAAFGELVKVFFLTLMFAMVWSTLFNFVMYSFISDERKENIVENMIQSQLSTYSSMGLMDEASLMQREEKLRDDFTVDKMFGLGNLLVGSVMMLFMYLVFALIGAGVFKKVRRNLD